MVFLYLKFKLLEMQKNVNEKEELGYVYVIPIARILLFLFKISFFLFKLFNFVYFNISSLYHLQKFT